MYVCTMQTTHTHKNKLTGDTARLKLPLTCTYNDEADTCAIASCGRIHNKRMEKMSKKNSKKAANVQTVQTETVQTFNAETCAQTIMSSADRMQTAKEILSTLSADQKKAVYGVLVSMREAEKLDAERAELERAEIERADRSIMDVLTDKVSGGLDMYLNAPYSMGGFAIQGRILTHIIRAQGLTGTAAIKKHLLETVIPYLEKNGITWKPDNRRDGRSDMDVLTGRINAHKLFLNRGGHATFTC